MKETTNKETKSNDPSIIRKNNIEQRLEQGEYIYTHKYHTEDHLSDIVKKYEKMEEIPDGETVKAAGRVMGIRKSKNWDFIDVLEAGTTIQCIVKKNEQPEELLNTNSDLYRGDIIGFEGYMIRTRTGHLSINITDLKLLTPCVRTLATQYYGIKDTEYLYRRRYIDLIINKESRNRFLTRSRIIKYLRHFLDSRDFIEVETPILDTTVGGANAKPFLTYHNELKLDMYMRVSPELYHKKLIVGGLERVYEVGRLFRNEGVDLTHNPEFTSCEFYMAYADYYDLVELTETFLSGLVKELFNSHTVKYSALKHGTEEHTEVVMDFTTPFKKIDMLDELTLQTGIELNGSNIESAEALQEMIDFCEKEGIIVEEPKTTARVIDKLVGHFIEPSCINPTFITNHPSIMSPLAKSHRTKKGLTERFELFMNGKEICNAYTELNDPFDQRRRFEAQAKDKMSGDGEAMMTDQSFIEALEFGLPPTGGWGIGIDRLVMYLTGASNIRDVILFPTMKPETN